MSSPVRQNRFQSFTPLRTGTHSLRRLKTAFSPTRSARSISPSSSTGTTSPLTRTASPHSHRSVSSNGSIRELLMLRRKPSVLDAEMEEEKHLFSNELEMLEPRPIVTGHVEVGIFEVLGGNR
ncbi:hypothetical protein BU24DRAFT_104726 [Aaosphaeria arxii CBS 175.79]|uniref:Uncharacterized protein n=1 Tax=Aaosphaeria arxii CBS 175.79 TaxID=1450172 RepID=A0A6A5Y2G1_9PLEO|nr:uncharacterized protein BU24DRAFT_104726 [Aaosphaeria arxii CBS 175.79]KAF2018764.1 hypothetical protein BU24DRAFT_104726 [Aaosphaeria arxii CBS 175.79]